MLRIYSYRYRSATVNSNANLHILYYVFRDTETLTESIVHSAVVEGNINVNHSSYNAVWFDKLVSLHEDWTLLMSEDNV